MNFLFNKFGSRLLEDLTGAPDWVSTWWAETVFRGLQEGDSDASRIDADREAGRAEQG